MPFDPKSKDKKQPSGGKPKEQVGPGAQHDLHYPKAPMGPKPGEGMDPMEAMMGGMGDMSQFGPPPPPAPGAPMGPAGLPVGGGLPGGDPNMDPNMGGSSLFQALNMGLDPMGGGMPGMGDPSEQAPPPELAQLLEMMALLQAGQGMQGPSASPSGVMPEMQNPGQTLGLTPNQVIQ